jgi:RNA polymerase sigma-70 factor, ECF subfamily
VSDLPDSNAFGRLLADARSGCRDALGRLLVDCSDYLFLIANQGMAADLRVKSSPSDIVQETFLEANRDFEQFQGERKEELLAWLRCILVNNVANTGRRFRLSNKRSIEREVRLPDAGSAIEEQSSPVGESCSASDRALQKEELLLLEQTLVRMPAKYQSVLRLRYREQLRFSEIGEQLSCSENAARKLWARTVLFLQRELRRESGR